MAVQVVTGERRGLPCAGFLWAPSAGARPCPAGRPVAGARGL